jgi:hypothetical protein
MTINYNSAGLTDKFHYIQYNNHAINIHKQNGGGLWNLTHKLDLLCYRYTYINCYI